MRGQGRMPFPLELKDGFNNAINWLDGNFVGNDRNGNFMEKPVQWILEPSDWEILKAIGAIVAAILLTPTVVGLLVVVPGVIEYQRQCAKIIARQPQTSNIHAIIGNILPQQDNSSNGPAIGRTVDKKPRQLDKNIKIQNNASQSNENNPGPINSEPENQPDLVNQNNAVEEILEEDKNLNPSEINNDGIDGENTDPLDQTSKEEGSIEENDQIHLNQTIPNDETNSFSQVPVNQNELKENLMGAQQAITQFGSNAIADNEISPLNNDVTPPVEIPWHKEWSRKIFDSLNPK